MSYFIVKTIEINWNQLKFELYFRWIGEMLPNRSCPHLHKMSWSGAIISTNQIKTQIPFFSLKNIHKTNSKLFQLNSNQLEKFICDDLKLNLWRSNQCDEIGFDWAGGEDIPRIGAEAPPHLHSMTSPRRTSCPWHPKVPQHPLPPSRISQESPQNPRKFSRISQESLRIPENPQES